MGGMVDGVKGGMVFGGGGVARMGGQQMVRHAARDVGCHGWGTGGGINGSGRRRFSPKCQQG